MSDHHDDPMIGKLIGERYQVERLIGKGGMSYVYQARDTTESRDVAVKIITLQRDRAKELERRFERESRVMKQLHGHQNIISIYDSGDVDRETYYLTMELIRGDTLTQRIKRYKQHDKYMPYEELIGIMLQIAAALDHMHQVAIHRDMKPSNIMIEKKTERAVLMDFGLVMDSVNNSTMGTAFGTPRYIAPEQAISSQQAVPQSDLYSLGVIIYECLTNHTPFDEESAMSMALSHITNQPPDPRDFRADLHEAVANVVLKALEKSPDDRYPTAQAFIKALEAAINGTPMPTTGVDQEETHRPDPTQGLPDGWQPTPSSESILTSEQKSLHLPKLPSKMPLFMGVGVVAIILAVALVAIFSGGGSSDPDNGAALQLLYSNNNLTIYNASGSTVNLSNYKLAFPDNNRVLDMNFFENKMLADSACVLVSLSTNDPAPEVCESVVRVTHGRRAVDNYYWVWDSSLNNSGEFVVLYRNREVQRCTIARGECQTRG